MDSVHVAPTWNVDVAARLLGAGCGTRDMHVWPWVEEVYRSGIATFTHVYLTCCLQSHS